MKWTDRYDAKIRSCSGAFLPWDWLWLKSQYIAESDLDPGAQSPAGAMGLAQFMRPTWDDVKRELNLPADATPFQTDHAIRAGAYYMGKLRRAWLKVERTEDDRRRLAQASYNAGIGNVLKAQQLAGNASDYASIIAQLHRVTGDAHAAETRGYVARIERIYNELSGVAA